MRSPRRLTARKLLVASLGVAAISYVGCGGNSRPDEPPTSGNLMAPPPVSTGPDDGPPTQGNLMPPPPIDAGEVPPAADAGAAQPTPPPSSAQPTPPASAVKPTSSQSAVQPKLPNKGSPIPDVKRPPTSGNLMAPPPRPLPEKQ